MQTSALPTSLVIRLRNAFPGYSDPRSDRPRKEIYFLGSRRSDDE